MAEANTQNLANTAWSFAQLVVRDEPLLTAIAAEALRKIEALVSAESAQESYALLWGLWRLQAPWMAFGEALASRLADGLLADALVPGLLLSLAEWLPSELAEFHLRLAVGRGLPAGTLRELWLREAAHLPSTKDWQAAARVGSPAARAQQPLLNSVNDS
eukprot:UN1182